MITLAGASPRTGSSGVGPAGPTARHPGLPGPRPGMFPASPKPATGPRTDPQDLERMQVKLTWRITAGEWPGAQAGTVAPC